MTIQEKMYLISNHLVYSAKQLISSDSYTPIARLECFARTMCGLGPAKDFTSLGLEMMQDLNIMSTNNPPQQALVEAAYLCMGFMRKPKLWQVLSSHDQLVFIAFITMTDSIKPINNNWLLFPAMVELFRYVFLGEQSMHKMIYALHCMEQWYIGDSLYKDGEHFQMDYYNSYVIHPMIFEIVDSMRKVHDFGYGIYLSRAQRYAVILENLISPEGTFPIMGRSSTYRFGAFAHLSDMLRRDLLPTTLNAAGVYNALASITLKMLPTYNFNDDGVLKVGLLGNKHVPEYYISEGSSYLCCMGLSHLNSFYNTIIDDVSWTQKRIWNDEVVTLEKSIHL